jgi:hypothetical protein
MNGFSKKLENHEHPAGNLAGRESLLDLAKNRTWSPQFEAKIGYL